MSKRRGRGRGNGFEAWGGYMAAKMAKLEDQFAEAAQNDPEKKESGLFHGIAIFVNGYTGLNILYYDAPHLLLELYT